MVRAGRGFGKTRTGAEYICRLVDQGYKRVALVAPTAADTRDVMIEGESGLMNIKMDGGVLDYKPALRRVIWPNGAMATSYSAEEPRHLNGPAHDAAWCDELGVWKYAQETWDMLMLGLRIGTRPRCIITTTPKNSRLVKAINNDPTTKVVTGSTYENKANLAPRFFDTVRRRYEGTRLGRQELYAEILEDVEGALWTRAMIDDARETERHAHDVAAELAWIVVAVDPSGSDGRTGDEIGIMIGGVDKTRTHVYILADETLLASPNVWGNRAARSYYDWGASLLVYEANFGGAMVGSTIHTVDKDIRLKKITASTGKHVRAAPVVSLYEQGRVHHVGGLAKLEDEMCGWVADESDWSPNRMDALVWLVTELAVDVKRGRVWL